MRAAIVHGRIALADIAGSVSNFIMRRSACPTAETTLTPVPHIDS